MKHAYSIKGMTCTGCLTTVKNRLVNVSGITDVAVSLASPQAVITMNSHIPLTVLQDALGSDKYIISAYTPPAVAVSDAAVADEKPASIYPILLIAGYITGISFLSAVSVNGTPDMMKWMQLFMAGFFIVFSGFKLLNIHAFADGYATYDVLASRWHGYGYIYPFMELGLGIAYLTGFAPVVTNAITLIVMVISTTGVALSLSRRKNIQCACLGTIIKLPLSSVTLTEDVTMLVMSVVMLMLL